MTARPVVCPACGYLGLIWASCQYCESDRSCLVNAVLPALTAGSETVCLDLDSYYEILLRTEGDRLPLCACHLQIEQPESYSAPSHSLNSTCAKLLITKTLRGYFVVVVVFFLLKRTVCASSYTADIFLAAWDEPEFADVMGWNDLELRPSLLKCEASHCADRNTLLPGNKRKEQHIIEEIYFCYIEVFCGYLKPVFNIKHCKSSSCIHLQKTLDLMSGMLWIGGPVRAKWQLHFLCKTKTVKKRPRMVFRDWYEYK